jgi:hypothetical protein
MASEPAARRTAQRVGLATPALLLVTPFVVFLRHHAYDIADPAALVCVGFLTAAGLMLGAIGRTGRILGSAATAAALAAFVDLQFAFETPLPGVGKTKVLAAGLLLSWALVYRFQPAERLIGIVSAVMLTSTLLVPQSAIVWRDERPAEREGDLPFVLHLVLDEHIGADGVPAGIADDLRDDLIQWFTSRNFALVNGAYSRWPATLRSSADTLNLRFDSPGDELVVAAERPFTNRLTRSAYFDGLKARGYVLNIYQPSYLDLCSAASGAAECETYAASRVGVIDDLAMPLADKVLVIGTAFAAQSTLLAELRETAVSLRARGFAAPVWSWDRTRVVPFSGHAALDRLTVAAARARQGEVLFGHVMLPHFPYVFDRQCRIRPVAEWLEPQLIGLPDARNSPESRALRYSRYGDQVRCTLRRLDALLDAIPEDRRRDAVVIVQGDHGPKISLRQPAEETMARLVPSDYADTYSALFAVRGPRLGGRTDGRQMPLGCLLRALVESEFGSLAGADGCAADPTVPFRIGAGQYVERPLPPFRAGASIAR